jgi:hypothetical protein
MYVRQAWVDPRLTFNQSEYGNDVLLPSGASSVIWMPDVYMRNQLKSDAQDGISTDNNLIKLSYDGKVWAVKHITVTLYCNVQLHRYPYDTQTCDVVFQSFKYTADDLALVWLSSPVSVDPGLQLQNFMLKDQILYDCTEVYTSGTFPCLEVRFVLARERGNYILQFFLPTIIIVAISWFALWMSANNFASRLQYLLTLLFLLMLVYAMTSINAASTSYVRMMDVWMLICVLMIILAMVQSLLLNILQPSRKSPETNDHESGSDQTILLGKSYNTSRARRITDLGARAGLPIIFLLIIIIFFSLYK